MQPVGKLHFATFSKGLLAIFAMYFLCLWFIPTICWLFYLTKMILVILYRRKGNLHHET